jgi:N-acetylglucosamine malate deacetylase 1
MENKYIKFVSDYVKLINKAKQIKVSLPSKSGISSIPKDAPVVLVFSPHPDDECIVGTLPLRLRRERGMRVINVAVTLGSRKDRQLERWQEVTNACELLGFDLIRTRERGLEKINTESRDNKPDHWHSAINDIKQVLAQHNPHMVFFPHSGDWNATHIGTSLLIQDALAEMGKDFCCWTCETEYWAPLDLPNLMVECSRADLTDLIMGVALHKGEVERNPYHTELPAWMHDNVRRGSELIGGKGAAAVDFQFATLYRLRKWAHGKFENIDTQGKKISTDDSLEYLLG